MKKILSILMVFLCASAMGQEVLFESDGIVYGITSEQTVEVLSNYYLHNTPYSGSIVIPQTVEYDGTTYTVTALGEVAFESCTTMTSLTLPPTIRSIGSHCFYNCTFTTLQLPDSLRRIDDHAFLYSSFTSPPRRVDKAGKMAVAMAGRYISGAFDVSSLMGKGRRSGILGSVSSRRPSAVPPPGI